MLHDPEPPEPPGTHAKTSAIAATLLIVAGALLVWMSVMNVGAPMMMLGIGLLIWTIYAMGVEERRSTRAQTGDHGPDGMPR